jgi:lysophospholipase L1-like esterase
MSLFHPNNPAACVVRRLPAVLIALVTAGLSASSSGGDEKDRRADPAGKRVRIVLVGDSTVTDDAGWGSGFAKHLADAECINLARSGRSSKSYIDEGHWAKALELKPTYVLIQFGHNDQPGKGPERETDPATTYRQYMSRYVDEARAAGARPILVTSMTRRHFTAGGKINSDLGPYVDAVKHLGRDKDVPVVDLHALSIARLEAMGPEAATPLNAKPREPGKTDLTHLSPAGSEIMAGLVVDELRKVAPDLARHLK